MTEHLQPLLMLGASNMFFNDENQGIYGKVVKGLVLVFLMKCYQIVNNLEFDRIISDYIQKNIFSFFSTKKNTYSLNYCSHNINIGYGNTKITKKIYSDTFLSIIHFIKENRNYINGIHNYQEILTNAVMYDWDESKKNQFTSLPINHNSIHIDTIDKIPIYVIINKRIIEDEVDNGKEKTNNSKIIDIYIELFSYINNNISEKMIKEALSIFLKKCEKIHKEYLSPINDNNIYIYDYKKFTDDDNGFKELKFEEHLFQSNKDMDVNVFFEGKQKLINYITPFIYHNEELTKGEILYNKLGKTFSGGILFSGEPGCGKSSTIKAILKKTNRHGIMINLSSIKSNEELESIFRNRIFKRKTYSGKQLCFIIEDCDASEDESLLDRSLKNKSEKSLQNVIFDSKINSSNNNDNSEHKKKELMTCLPFMKKDTFDLNCFLNVLDGIIELHGVMVIMTTNYKEKLDKALIRDGRIDFKYEFKKASKEVIRDMLKLKFDVSDEEFSKNKCFNQIKDYILSPATIQSISFKNDSLEECIKQILYESQNSK